MSYSPTDLECSGDGRFIHPRRTSPWSVQGSRRVTPEGVKTVGAPLGGLDARCRSSAPSTSTPAVARGRCGAPDARRPLTLARERPDTPVMDGGRAPG